MSQTAIESGVLYFVKTFRKNDIGLAISLRIKDDDGNIINISTATTKTLHFLKPDRTAVSKTASFYTDGTDGIITYSLESGFLDTVGIWEVEGYVIMSGVKPTTTKAKFRVEEAIV